LARFAQRPAPLSRDAHRLRPLLGDVAPVDDECALLRIAARCADVRLVRVEHGVGVPGALPDELLERLHVAAHHRVGQRLDRLALQVKQLAVQVEQRRAPLLAALEQRGEAGVVGHQVGGEALHIAWRQVRGRRLRRRRRAQGGVGSNHQRSSSPQPTPRPPKPNVVVLERTYNVYLNDVAYWSNVPAHVWEYTIGGYQVIRKWLSYRESDLLDRSLT
jgi:hypothetical protein